MIDTTVIFYDEFTDTGGGGVDFLLGNVCDKIKAVITVDIHWESEMDMVTFTGTNTITRNDYNGSFVTDGFKVGDTFETESCGANDGTTFTILTVAAKVITASGLTNGVFNTAILHGTTPVTSVDYFYNLIEKSATANYNSLVDAPNTMKYTAKNVSTANATPANMIAQGISKGWTLPSPYIPTIAGAGVSSWIQTFTISHWFLIVPFDLSGQFENIENNIAPSYFIGDKCLKYVNGINARFQINDPCIPHTGAYTDCGGNTGWRDEQFNGGLPNYSLFTISYTDKATGDPVTALQYCRETNVHIRLVNSINGFISTLPMALSFFWLPKDNTIYKNTTTNMIDNFKFDRRYFIEGAPASNGDNYGTDNQVLTDVYAVIYSANVMDIYFTANLSTAFNNYLDASTQRDYVIQVAIQNQNINTTIGADRVCVKCDANTFICDRTVVDYSGIL